VLTKHWKIWVGVAVGGLILFLAYLNRHWLLEAYTLARTLHPGWLLLAFGIIVSSFLVASRVFRIILSVQRFRHIDGIRLWAIALVSIVLSQAIPAGGVWSYAFLVTAFRQRGLSTTQSAVVATMDMLSYGVAMVSIVSFSLIYLAFHNLTTEEGSLFAAVFALIIVLIIVFIFTRSDQQLKYWGLALKRWVTGILPISWSDKSVLRFVSEITHGREMIRQNPRDVLLTVPLQFIGLCGHSPAMLVILHGLGVDTSFLVVLSSFGIALLTSTFNVLPGGGGTVETAIVAALLQFGVGKAALPAAIIFRLLNFWFIVPIAFGCYYWLMHTPSSPPSEDGGNTDTKESITPTEPIGEDTVC
jgi:uncharacterized protein (TIRG00374 family)